MGRAPEPHGKPAAKRNPYPAPRAILGRDGIRMMTENLEKQDWKRIMFYADIVVVGVFLIALGLALHDTYYAGYYRATGAHHAEAATMWNIAKEAAFITGALAWIFVRYFRNRISKLQHPWL